jgi:hypothetical protein|nr:MAG TPA: hypothetical protein [Caudoviricetes sp.]
MSDDAIYPDGPQPVFHQGQEADAAAPAPAPAPQAQDGAAEGELFVTNLLAEIANLTKRAIMAETIVAVLQSKAKSGQ